MKKIFLLTTLLILFGTTPGYCDGLVFDETPVPETTIPAADTNKSEIEPAITNENNTQNVNNLQNAIYQIDSAQVGLRDKLVEAKAKYNEIDNEYKLVKEKRSLQSKEVRATEKKIKNLEKTKERLRKTMNNQNG